MNTKEILQKCLAGSSDPALNKEIEKHLTHLDNTIQIEWHIKDVKQQAKDEGKTITDEQAQEVLGSLECNHDCNYGVTWEYISNTIDQVLGENQWS